MKTRVLGTLLAASLWGLAGCQEQIRPSDMTFSRGTQLLAAGSPKSAIPFLTQTVASTPDGPEPLAALSLAYALDLQPERAIAQAQLVRRAKGQAPGWEAVACGIAEMTRHRPAEAIASLRRVTESVPQTSITPAARQWLALAQVLNGGKEQAITELQSLAGVPGMETSSQLWIVLIEAQAGNVKGSTEALTACAKGVASRSGQASLAESLGGADDQTLYDAGVAALSVGDAEGARRHLLLVQQHNPAASDAPVWLGLIAATKGGWQTARTQLKEACEQGSSESRGLANQLFSVVCAMEDRPEAMVQHTMAGQRLLNRGANSLQPVAQPAPEKVWSSDQMK